VPVVVPVRVRSKCRTHRRPRIDAESEPDPARAACSRSHPQAAPAQLEHKWSGAELGRVHGRAASPRELDGVGGDNSREVLDRKPRLARQNGDETRRIGSGQMLAAPGPVQRSAVLYYDREAASESAPWRQGCPPAVNVTATYSRPTTKLAHGKLATIYRRCRYTVMQRDAMTPNGDGGTRVRRSAVRVRWPVGRSWSRRGCRSAPRRGADGLGAVLARLENATALG